MSFNLISRNKITKDLNCKFIFGTNFVSFQEKETNRVMSEGKASNGIYLVNRIPQALGLVSIVESSLWLARLGHPYSKALQTLFRHANFKNRKCEACIYGEQIVPSFENLIT